MSEQSSLGHLPEGKWKFDSEVSGCFEDMLDRSIPQLASMRELVSELAAHYVQPSTDIVDLGCSHGEGVKPLLDKFGAANRFVLCDSSEPMIGQCRQRYEGWTKTGVMRILQTDLRSEFPKCRASVILAVLSLQFVPMEYRLQVVRRAYERLLSGGALILVEKVLGSCSELEESFSAGYRSIKARNGYSAEEIDRKREALEGVLVPMAARWNEEMLRSAGFTQVDCFFRWLNFSGWVALK